MWFLLRLEIKEELGMGEKMFVGIFKWLNLVGFLVRYVSVEIRRDCIVRGINDGIISYYCT